MFLNVFSKPLSESGGCKATGHFAAPMELMQIRRFSFSRKLAARRIDSNDPVVELALVSLRVSAACVTASVFLLILQPLTWVSQQR